MTLKEKIGYGFGDMASSMFWKLFSYFLPFFYSNVFGLGLGDAAILMLVTRIWDAVSDPMMGIIADRTQTRWGKYRPYLLFFAVPFAVAGVLLFTTPDNGKVFWAYMTYILMMTVYTGINVPYGAMLNTMTTDSDQKSVLSSYRMFFAYAGSFIALFAWEPLCNMFAPEVKEDASVAKIELTSEGQMMIFAVHDEVFDYYDVEDQVQTQDSLTFVEPGELAAKDVVMALAMYDCQKSSAEKVFAQLKDVDIVKINDELAASDLQGIKLEKLAESYKNLSRDPGAWRNAMIVISVIALVLFLLCFMMTREHVKSVSSVSIGADFKLLLRNKPWWLLIGAALGSNLFNTVRGTTVAYFFADYLTQYVHVSSTLGFLFSASVFLAVGEIANMVAPTLSGLTMEPSLRQK